MPKISVIIPVYNVEKYLKRCLDSICNQTLKEIEILCINDCSTDNSLQILQFYAQKDSRLQIIDLKTNKNVSFARNCGLKVAQGEYIGFVDSDDLIDLEFYEKLYNKAIQDNADIAKAGCLLYTSPTDAILSDLNTKIRQNSKYFFTHEWWSAIYRRKLIEEKRILFPLECTHSEDIVFLNTCIIHSNSLSLVDEVYYHYIRRNDSIDTKYLAIKHIKSALTANAIILENLNTCTLYNEDRRAFIIAYLRFLNAFSSTAYRNEDREAIELSAEFLIVSFYKCRDVELLKSVFIYPFLLDYILEKNLKGLVEELGKYSSFGEMIRAKRNNS